MMLAAVLCGLSLLACATAAPAAVTVGVDYYPEQWAEADMKADITSIKHDLGADVIRIGEFMWHTVEPSDGVFDFTLLDSIIGAAEAVGLSVILGTPTATMPAWLYHSHPEVASVGPDSPDGYAGATAGFGGRRQYSFNSPVYLTYVRRMVSKLAERYGGRKGVVSWQVDNEIGHEGSDLDFSPPAEAAWRKWLAEVRFGGSIAALNEAWGTVFWGTTYDAFEQVPLPKWTIPGSPARPNENFRSNSNPGMLLDYRRFRADSIAAFAGEQVAILRNATQKGGQSITSNSPGGVWAKALDSNTIFEGMDFVSYDNYPVWGGSIEPTAPSMVAMQLDLVRGWGQYAEGSFNGFTVMEQLIGAQGHDIIGFTPRPRQIIAWSAQTLLHGATSLLFFRYRAAAFGQEEFCYGVLDHTTPMASGRKWDEAKELFALARGAHQPLWLAPVVAKVALLYTPSNIFAWQAQPQSTAFDFQTEAHRLYHGFWRHGTAVDVISSERLEGASGKVNKGRRGGSAALVPLSNYQVVLLPAPMLVSDELYDALEAFVKSGGSLICSFRSDLKSYKTNQMRRSTSRLAALAGVQIEEIESLNAPVTTQVRSSSSSKAGGAAAKATGTVSASVWREALSIIPDSGAVPLFEYTDDEFFGGLGYKAVTRRLPKSGGEVVYVATGIDPAALVPVAAFTLNLQGIDPGFASLPEDEKNVEQMMRKDSAGNEFSVRINYGTTPANVTLANGSTFQVRPYGIDIRPHDPVNTARPAAATTAVKLSHI